MAVLEISSGPYTKIWVSKTEGTPDVSWHYLMLFALHCTSLKTCAESDNISYKAAWLLGLKYIQACAVALIGWPLGLSTSDNNNYSNMDEWKLGSVEK